MTSAGYETFYSHFDQMLSSIENAAGHLGAEIMKPGIKPLGTWA